MPSQTTWIIGGDPACDVVIDRPSVSWRHCRLTLEADGTYVLEDLGSTNGTFVNGQRIFRETRVIRQDAIALGLSVPMIWPAEPTVNRARAETIIRVGRDPDNDLVIESPEVSGRHARVIFTPGA